VRLSVGLSLSRAATGCAQNASEGPSEVKEGRGEGEGGGEGERGEGGEGREEEREDEVGVYD